MIHEFISDLILQCNKLHNLYVPIHRLPGYIKFTGDQGKHFVRGMYSLICISSAYLTVDYLSYLYILPVYICYYCHNVRCVKDNRMCIDKNASDCPQKKVICTFSFSNTQLLYLYITRSILNIVCVFISHDWPTKYIYTCEMIKMSIYWLIHYVDSQ